MSTAEFCPMGKIEKLLLATDWSDYSEGAVTEAISLARKCAAELYAISVIEINPEYETFGTDVIEKEEKEVATYFESLKTKALKEGVSCRTILRESGEPYRLIVEEAEKKKVDMIIIGRHGRKGLAKVLMGSVAAKVIGHAPCNVLVVPRAAVIEFRNILVATDGSTHGNAAASEAIGIAKRCGSHIIAVSAFLMDDELEEAKTIVSKVIKAAQEEGVSAEGITPRGRPYNAIVETAGGRAVDLIVMSAYGKTGLRKLLMGSSTEKVVGLAGCSVMVVRHA